MKRIKIGQAFSTIRNGASIKQDKLVDGVPITRIETISNGLIDLNRLGYASVKGESYENFYLKDGDILMSHINSISHLGKVAIFENRNEKIIHGMNLLCLKANSEKLLPKYAFYYLKSLQFRSSINKITKKSVNQASFNISNLKEIEIPIPETLFDQIRIANILNKAETLISQRKESIRLLDEFLKSTFLEMFGDPVRNEKRWENRTIEQLVRREKYSLKRGPFGGALKKEIFVPSGYLVYEQFHALNNDFSFARYYINENKFQELKGFAVKPGDIIISCSGVYLGKLAIVPKGAKNGIINQALLKITLDDKLINNQFFVFLFSHESFKNKFYGNFIGSGIPNFPSMIEFKRFLFIYPPLELQTKFAQIVEKTETLKNQYQQSLLELENLYGCLSQKAFKGELSFKEEKLMMAAEPEVPYSKNT